MKNKNISLFSGLLIGMGTITATQAASINLFDYAFNIDSSITFSGDALPTGINAAGFDFVTGLGSIGFSVSGAGAHTVDAFFDHEIDAATNTFFNETGSTGGAPGGNQSWEIDEPGYVYGDIYFNFQDSLLSNNVDTAGPEDISMAMGWDFSLASNETALINLLLSETAPTSGFFLKHSDLDSNSSIYLSSSLSITTVADPITAVPVPGALWLMMSGLLGLAAVKRRA